MTRNYTIDCIKLLLSAMIACHHFKGIFISSTTVVHIFFILSGFFLAQSFYRGKYGNDTFRYTCARLKRIYPYYLFAFFAYFLFTEKRILITEPITFCKDFCNSFSEIFLLQNVGIFGGGANYPLWQLCTLLVVSHVLFSLMVHDEQLTANVFCPLLFIGIYTYLANVYSTEEVNLWGVEFKFFYVPLLVALGSVSFGIAIYRPVTEAVQWFQVHLSELQISAISVVSLVIFWATRNNYVSHLIFVVILICCLSNKGFLCLLNRNFFACGEKLSLAIYLNHALVILLYNRIFAFLNDQSIVLQSLIYLCMVFIYSVCMLKIVDWLKPKISHRFLKSSSGC